MKKDKKKQKIAEKWWYQPRVKEVENEEFFVHRATIGAESDKENDLSNKLVEEFFIQQTDRPIAWGAKDLNPQMGGGRAKSINEIVPEKFHWYLKVFEKKASERMPVRKLWDHVIDMKPGFEPKKAKIFPLSPQEQKEVEEFLNDQLSNISKNRSHHRPRLYSLCQKRTWGNEWYKTTNI
jgi:hypothetical protein